MAEYWHANLAEYDELGEERWEVTRLASDNKVSGTAAATTSVMPDVSGELMHPGCREAARIAQRDGDGRRAGRGERITHPQACMAVSRGFKLLICVTLQDNP